MSARAATAAVLALALGACEAPLDPIAPSGAAFSMSGYLDASADTQWVRVEPFGARAGLTPGPIDAEVALELPGGRRVPMAPSVRAFPSGPAHLFWTTADVLPGATYAVVARRSDGAGARAPVRIPDDRAVTITLDDGPIRCPTTVLVEGAERLAQVEARYELRGTGRLGETFRFPKLESLVEEADGAFRAQVFYGEDAVEMEIDPLPFRYPVTTEVFVALATDDWPDLRGLALDDALHAADTGRIEGGVGFVGGALTKTVPFVPGFGRIPYELDPTPPSPCVSDPYARAAADGPRLGEGVEEHLGARR